MQLLDGAFGHPTIVVIHEREPARASRIAIGRDDDLQWRADGTEVVSNVGFGRTVREISDE
jgi:hypothetical protein